VGEGNENVVYSSPWNFKSSLTYPKIVRHGTFRLSFPSEGKMYCGLFITFQKPLAGFEPATSQAGTRNFFSCFYVQTTTEGPPSLVSSAYRGSFSDVKPRPGSDLEHSWVYLLHLQQEAHESDTERYCENQSNSVFRSSAVPSTWLVSVVPIVLCYNHETSGVQVFNSEPTFPSPYYTL
jgi:hypothetical protein